MPGPSVSRQLQPQYSRITELVYATPLLYSNVFNLIRLYKKNGADIPIPSFTASISSHNSTLGRHYRACILMARDYMSQAINTGCRTQWIEVDGFGDFLNDAYKKDVHGAAMCSTANLGNIVVASYDEALRETGCNAAAVYTTNYGTGALASRAELQNGVAVRRGWVYDRDAAGVAQDLMIEIRGKQYVVPVVDAARDGKPGINYYYVDQFGKFIAGPDGTDAAADPATGFGAAGAAVTGANHIKLFDYFGQWYNQENKFLVGSSEIQKYDFDCAMIMRDNFMSGVSAQRAWDRAVGQEFVDKQGSRSNVANEGGSADGVGSGGVSLASVREHKSYATGAQTKRDQIDCAVSRTPLMHYHNWCRADSLPTALLADLNVRYEFTTIPDKYIFEAVANDDINIMQKVYLYPVDAAGAIIPPAAQTADHPEITLQKIIPYVIPGSVVEAEGLQCSELVYNLIYVDKLLHVPLAVRIWFQLIRLWCPHVECFQAGQTSFATSKTHSSSSKCEIQHVLNEISYPSEALWVCERPDKHLDYNGGSPDISTRWHANGHVGTVKLTNQVSRVTDVDDTGANRHRVEQLEIKSEHADVHYPVVQRFSFDVHNAEYMKMFDREHYDTLFKYVYANTDCIYMEERQVPRAFVIFSDKPKSEGANYGVSSVSARQWITAKLDGVVACIAGDDHDRDGLVGGLDYVGSANASINSSTGKKLTLMRIIYCAWCINFILGAEANIALRFDAN